MHDTDSAEHAAHLARRTALAEGVHAMPTRPVLHGDNGATLKATTVLAMLHWLGIKPSYSRPRVSDDNAFAEALFRTAKYRPEFPLKGFADLDAARQWAMRFVQWYNHEHRHSGIRYVTPAQRHAGQDGRRARRPPRGLPERTANATRNAGVGRPATGRRSASSRSIRSATLIVQAARSQIQLSGSIGEPAFPSRPGSAQATERNAGDGRSGATRSHAQRTSFAREHGEDGEHGVTRRFVQNRTLGAQQENKAGISGLRPPLARISANPTQFCNGVLKGKSSRFRLGRAIRGCQSA